MKQKALAAVIVLALIQANPAHGAATASFTVINGQTVTTAQALNGGQTGTIQAGGSLIVGSTSNAITVSGNATIVNDGTLEQTATGNNAARDIRDNTGGLTLTVTNGAGALMQTADDDVIQMNKANSNVTFNNYGTLNSLNQSAGGAQAIDFNAITSGVNIVNNYATGVIKANEADAVRPGVNGQVYNNGLILATNNPGSTDSSDGVDAQSNTGISVVNDTQGKIEGARHGITGGNTDVTTNGAYTMSVTNNQGGVIQGDDGSGMNIDGFNANEVVTVVNHGTITGNGVTRDGDGVDVDGMVNITNTGTIQSLHAYDDNSEGITVGGGSIVNSGTIVGLNSATNADGTANTGIGRGITLAGIDKDPTTGNPIPIEGIYGNTTVTNSGLIRGQSDSAIAVTGAANAFTVTITNLAGGTLEGGGATAAAVNTGANQASVIDYGTITADSSHLAVYLGSANSSLQILGGSAQINGNIDGGTGSSTLTITPGAGNAFSYDDAIADFAGVTLGAGTVTLNGASSYSGNTTLTGGTLVLGNNSAIGTGSLITGSGANVAYGNGIVLPNTITLTDNSTTLEVDGNNSATQAGAISGAFGLSKTGSGTLILDGVNTYSGTTTVQAGTLEVGDSSTPGAAVAGNVSVTAGGTLRGHGSIGGNVVNNGTVWPGGSIGTLTINGNYTQGAQGVLNIDATPSGQSGLLLVKGSASIQGSTVVLAQSGNWAPRTNYTILTAAGGISGQFASATSSLTFLTPQLSYAADSVTLSLERNDAAFASVAQTPNEREAAGAIESLGWNSAVYNAIVLDNAATAAQAFDQLSGQIYASTRTALSDDSRYVREAVQAHLLGLANGANGLNATADNGITAWTDGWGHWGDHNGNSNAARLQADGSGLLVGADMPFGTAHVGVVAGSSQNSARLDTLDSSSHTTGTHLGAYGSIRLDAFQLLGGASYAWQQVSTNRTIAFQGFNATPASRYDADTAQAFVDASYAFSLGRSTLSPYVNLARVQLHTDAADESSDAAALRVNAQTSASNEAQLGLRGVFALDARGDINAHASVGWQRAWGDIATQSTVQFESGGNAFQVAGVPLARHAGVVDAGVSFALSPTFSADVSYNGQFAGSAKDQAARMNFTWSF
ncbi:autotransporter domain-containing protein [Dyella acidiphila]|uniref:Autotransporter domain-containing protein n=1 Tax=Dyella acidiphila TaxID=2775866 RepID=A0ABR9G748_9GAMM|nr:autotransporter domain-containing protein [Dyella acidiphila]MBE1159877.1 autotransporter domain-containing protein [Dyella acidiphila]